MGVFLILLLALMAVLGVVVWFMGVMERRRTEKAYRRMRREGKL